MKQFKEYQYIGGRMNDRDKQEIGSKFWNEGKWDNFILPFLPDDCSKLSLIDMGCNAGLFCKLAKEKGFDKVIGVEADVETYNKAYDFKKKNKINYRIINSSMDIVIDALPVSDYFIYVNSHYYLEKDKWLCHIEKLKEKAINVIIVSVKKKPNQKYANSDLKGILNDFRDWKIKDIIKIDKDETPHSRNMFSICFTNPNLKRVNIDTLDNGNRQQRDFLKQIDKGFSYQKTDYYRRLKDYRKRTGSKQTVWTQEELDEYMYERVRLYEDVRKKGLIKPIYVRQSDNRIVDGNHRHEILKHLNYKTIICKEQ